jgi:hypothetical protein
MFPLSFTSFNGLKSIIARVRNPFQNSVDNVYDLATNDPVTFLSLAKNAPPLVFLGLVVSSGFCYSNQKMFSSCLD